MQRQIARLSAGRGGYTKITTMTLPTPERQRETERDREREKERYVTCVFRHLKVHKMSEQMRRSLLMALARVRYLIDDYDAMISFNQLASL